MPLLSWFPIPNLTFRCVTTKPLRRKMHFLQICDDYFWQHRCSIASIVSFCGSVQGINARKRHPHGDWHACRSLKKAIYRSGESRLKTASLTRRPFFLRVVPQMWSECKFLLFFDQHKMPSGRLTVENSINFPCPYLIEQNKSRKRAVVNAFCPFG